MEDTEKHIKNLFLTLPKNLATLAQELRSFLKNKTSPRIELVFTSANSINIGYGFTKKAWDCYCGIIIYSKHINLSFPSGASLDDPEQLLQGNGKRVRHIRINRLEQLNQPEVLQLINQARDIACKLAKEKHNEDDQFKTIVK